MWSYLLMSVGVLGLWLVGSKKSIGWVVGISAQVLWVVYGVVTHQYGFVISAFVYGGVYLRGLVKFEKAKYKEQNDNDRA